MTAAPILEGIVAQHPDFAPAWLLLSSIYNLMPTTSPARNGSAEDFRKVVDAYIPKGEAVARRALQLDPTLTIAYGQLAVFRWQSGKPLEAEELFLKGLSQDFAGEQVHGRGLMLADVGRLKDALALRRQLQSAEPFVPGYNRALAEVLWLNGQTEDAIAQAQTLPADQRGLPLALFYTSMGNYTAAVNALAALPPTAVAADAVRLLRTAPARATNPKSLPALGVQYAWVYLAVGGETRVLDNYETLVGGGRLPPTETSWLWHPLYAAVRQTERFRALMRKAGFVDYWRAKGWPDLCHPTIGDDFACE
jgi:tetratricopeptide (TPR) repeat protein